MIYEERKRDKQYCQMTISDLKALSSDEFLEALSARILQEEGHMDVEESLVYFEGAKRIFFIVDYFDMEIQDGGLCQFFVNSSRMVAPYIIEALKEINAIRYKELLEKFICDNRLSMEDLASFEVEDIEEYEQKLERYPFDEFDEVYCELYEIEPLNMLLENYCRRHIADFA